jgi:putative IMPACT (imprinted ancient) family translation regulator
LIGVVRYYGGTKLGVGGLINAYRTAAKEAIEEGEIIVKEVYEWVRLEFNYNDMPTVMSFIKKFDLHIEKQNFELNCEMVLSLPLNQKENLKAELNDLSSMEITILGIY